MSAVNALLDCVPNCYSRKSTARNTKRIGNKQSPVNIVTKDVTPDPYLRDNPLQWDDTGLRGTSISNNGNTWEVSVKAAGTQPSRGTSAARLPSGPASCPLG
ncbi:hypothetical protein MTO96_039532 [Rhipicephalus appendiculatus]